MHRLGDEVALDDDVRFGEAGIEIAGLERRLHRDVRRLGRRRILTARHHALVEENGVVGHRLVDGHHLRQHFVAHLDRGGGLARLTARGGGHRGHRLTLVAHAVARHQVVGGVAHRVAGRELGEVVARDDRLDAGHRERGLGVDRDDLRVRVRRAQHVAVEHAGQDHVGGESSAAGDLVEAIRANRPRADELVWIRLGGGESFARGARLGRNADLGVATRLARLLLGHRRLERRALAGRRRLLGLRLGGRLRRESRVVSAGLAGSSEARGPPSSRAPSSRPSTPRQPPRPSRRPRRPRSPSTASPTLPWWLS